MRKVTEASVDRTVICYRKTKPVKKQQLEKIHKAQIPSNEIIIQEIFMLFNLRFIL